jgi:hypothetical protein
MFQSGPQQMTSVEGDWVTGKTRSIPQSGGGWNGGISVLKKKQKKEKERNTTPRSQNVETRLKLVEWVERLVLKKFKQRILSCLSVTWQTGNGRVALWKKAARQMKWKMVQLEQRQETQEGGVKALFSAFAPLVRLFQVNFGPFKELAPGLLHVTGCQWGTKESRRFFFSLEESKGGRVWKCAEYRLE